MSSLTRTACDVVYSWDVILASAAPSRAQYSLESIPREHAVSLVNQTAKIQSPAVVSMLLVAAGMHDFLIAQDAMINACSHIGLRLRQ